MNGCQWRFNSVCEGEMECTAYRSLFYGRSVVLIALFSVCTVGGRGNGLVFMAVVDGESMRQSTTSETDKHVRQHDAMKEPLTGCWLF